MGPISCARLLPPVAPLICCAKMAFDPSVTFAECPAEKFFGGAMRGPIRYTRQLSRVAPRRCTNLLSIFPFGPCVMFVSASRSLLFGVTRRNNYFIYIYIYIYIRLRE